MGLIAVLAIIAIILLVLIVRRPRYINIDEVTESMATTESSESLPSNEEASSTPSTEEVVIQENETILKRGKTSTRVNIRELPSADSRVLETVEEGYEFDIVEITTDGWTKIIYGESTAYISSDYVILITN